MRVKFDIEAIVDMKERTVHTQLAALCSKVEMDSTDDDDPFSVLFQEPDLAVKMIPSWSAFYNIITDQSGEFKDNILTLCEKHKHVMIVIIGDLESYTYDAFDRKKTGNPFLMEEDRENIYRQLIGARAKIVAFNNIEGFEIWGNVVEAAYSIASYADDLKNARKHISKEFVLSRPPIDKNKYAKINMIRCARGFDILTALEVDKVVSLYDLVSPPEDMVLEWIKDVQNKDRKSVETIIFEVLSKRRNDALKKLMSIKGIGEKKALSLLDAFGA